MYDDFWTQTPLGLLEFSDRPLKHVPEGERYFGFFKAHHVARYLEDYCDDHLYGGVPLRSRIHSDEPVTDIHKKHDLWHITTERGDRYAAPHIIDATGLTNIPNYPDLPDHKFFKGTIIHHRDFAKWEPELKEGKRKRIVVIGGAKSAADVAYACAKRNHEVTWLIRRSGSGPAAFVSVKGTAGYTNSNEAFYTRLTSLFLVSFFTLGSYYTTILRLINNTLLGQRILRLIWKTINDKAWKEADYDRAEGRTNGFHNLKPDTELFWQNDSTGVNQRPDFFDIVAHHVKVVREDLSHLCELGVVLRTAEVLTADVLICATGWKTEHPYFKTGLAADLGLPVGPQNLTDEVQTFHDGSEKLSDLQVIGSFPILDSDWARSNGEVLPLRKFGKTPLRLWKSIVPIHDPSILFVGKVMLGNHFRAAEVQALFACGVFDRIVLLPSADKMTRDVSTTLAWCRRRYLKKGILGNWFYWDMVPYTDMLLCDMGLSSHRHPSWWKDLFRPCYARDLAGLIDEYQKKLDQELDVGEEALHMHTTD